MLKSEANPEGLPMEVFDGLRAGLVKDRSQFYKDLAILFYGANRPGAEVSRAILDQFWLWSMQSGLKNSYESIKAFSETDFTEDLQKIDVPTLVMHGEDDQIVPAHDSARKSARLITGAQEIYYPGAPHGLTATLQDQVNADLLDLPAELTLLATRRAGLSAAGGLPDSCPRPPRRDDAARVPRPARRDPRRGHAPARCHPGPSRAARRAGPGGGVGLELLELRRLPASDPPARQRDTPTSAHPADGRQRRPSR